MGRSILIKPQCLKTVTLVSLALLASLFLLYAGIKHIRFTERSEFGYWVWRNTDMNQVSEVPNSKLYLYQGNLTEDWSYQPLGLQPIALEQSEIVLVLRLYALVDVNQVSQLYNELVKQWARVGMQVTELQIDYDSPSSKLDLYAAWLNRLASLIDQNLSVTSLATYIWDNPLALRSVAKEVDYLAMQLYQGFRPHPHYQSVIKWLVKSNIPHKLGITQAEEFSSVPETCKKPCKGVIVFLNIKE